MRAPWFHHKELSRCQTIKDRQSSCSYSISPLGLSEETLGQGATLGTILGIARFAVLAGALASAGCVTTENSLSKNDIAAMKLTSVTVSFAPDANVQWEDGIRAYATAKSIPDDEIATRTNTPEGKAYVQNLLAPKIKSGVERVMAGQLNGTRPVRLDIVVKSFTIASAVQRILIGGGYGMAADTNLVDAKTGMVIIAHPNLTGVLLAGQGVLGTAVQAAIDNSYKQGVPERIIENYAEGFRDWLLPRA
jgi:hypothetical protein